MKRKLKSCISLILAVLMLTTAFSSLPVTANAAELCAEQNDVDCGSGQASVQPRFGKAVIRYVNAFGFTPPVAGETPCKASDLLCEAHILSGYYAESCKWFKVQGTGSTAISSYSPYTFEKGEAYYAIITFKARSYFCFDWTGNKGLDQFDSVCLNGVTDYVDAPNSEVFWENELHVKTTQLVADDPQIIRNVAVEGDLTLTTGDEPLSFSDFSVSVNAPYRVHEIGWRDGVTGKKIDAPEILESGKKYKLDIYIKPGYGYRFEKTGYYGLSQFDSVSLNGGTEQLDTNNSAVYRPDSLAFRTKVLTVTDPGGTTGDCTWSLDPITGLMTIDGTGAMESSYNEETEQPELYTPWREYKSKIKKLVMGGGVTNVGQYAFFDCENLAEVEIGGSVNIIDWSAFKNCKSLTSIEFPNNVETIGYYAFTNCTELSSVSIGGAVRDVRIGAFMRCTKLKSVMIPANVTEIGANAFGVNYNTEQGFFNYPGFTIYGATGSAAQTYAAENNIAFVAVDGVTGDCGWQFDSGTGTLTISGGGAMGNYSQAANVPWNQYKSRIIAVVFNGGVTSIGDYCFYGMPNLATVYIPPSVKKIGKWAFATSAIDDVNLTGVETIDNYAFSDCTDLMAASLGDSLKYIEASAFYGCTSLSSVSFGSKTEDIGANAFFDCSNLISVNFPSSLRIIGDSAFENCTGLENVDFAQEDSQLYYIGQHAFKNCYNFSTLDLPDSVRYIMNGAFRDCENLFSVDLSKELCQLGNKAFYNTNLAEIHMYGVLNDIGYHAVGYRLGDTEDVARDLNIYGVSGSEAEAYASTESCFIFYPTSCEGSTGDCYWYYDSTSYILEITGSGSVGSYNQPQLAPWYGLHVGELRLGKNVTGIGKYAFCGINGAYIPETVQTIGEKAVGYDEYGDPIDGYLLYGYRDSAAEEYADSHGNIRFVDLKPRPNHMGSAGIGAAWSFNSSNGTLTVYPTAAYGEMYDYEVFESKPWSYLGDQVKKVVIDRYITKIGDFAFADMNGIREVSLTSDVAAIGDAAFYNTGLQYLTVPNRNCHLGSYCFGYQNFPNGGLFDTMESATITGYKNSTAQAYANNEAHIKFANIEGNKLDLGDISGEGRIDINDATELQFYLAEMFEEPLSGAQLDASDVDDDGFVTINDATKLQKYLAGIIGSL